MLCTPNGIMHMLLPIVCMVLRQAGAGRQEGQGMGVNTCEVIGCE